MREGVEHEVSGEKRWPSVYSLGRNAACVKPYKRGRFPMPGRGRCECRCAAAALAPIVSPKDAPTSSSNEDTWTVSTPVDPVGKHGLDQMEAPGCSDSDRHGLLYPFAGERVITLGWTGHNTQKTLFRERQRPHKDLCRVRRNIIESAQQCESRQIQGPVPGSGNHIGSHAI